MKRISENNFSLIAIVAILFCLTGCMSYEKRLAECDSVGDFHDGYALCRQDEKSFFINEKGKRVSGKYDHADDFSNGYAVVYNNIDYETKQFYIIDKDLKQYVYPISGYSGTVNKWGNLWVTAGWGGWSLLNVESGSFRLSNIYGIRDIGGGNSTVVCRIVDKMYYEFAIYDGQGNEVVPFGKYSYIGHFVNGLAHYSTTGRLFYEPMCERIFERNKLHGLYRYSADPGYLGYIDAGGNVVIPEQYNYADDFTEKGYAQVTRGKYNARDYVIDKRGNILTDKSLAIAIASYLDDGVWASGRCADGKYILANNKGEVEMLDGGVPTATSNLYIGKQRTQYVATRNGHTYKIYRVEKNTGNITYKCTVKGKGLKGEIVYFDGGIICVNYDNYTADRYTLNGEFISSVSSYLKSNNLMKRCDAFVF